MPVPIPLPRPLVGNPSGDTGIFDNIGSALGGVFERVLDAGGGILENLAALQSARLQQSLAELTGISFDDPAQVPVAQPVAASSGFSEYLPWVLGGVGAVVLLVALWPKSR